MKIIMAPTVYNKELDEIACFVGGGTQGENWRNIFIETIFDYGCNHLVLYNPQRKDFDSLSFEERTKQIEWEFNYLNKYVNDSFIFSMYFNKDSLQPISFYEVGRTLAIMRDNLEHCVISVHPEFSKKDELKAQVKLATNDKVAVVECGPQKHAGRVVGVYREMRYSMYSDEN